MYTDRHMKKLIALLSIISAFTFCSTALASNGYPAHTYTYVNDFAKVLTPDDINTLQSQLSKFDTDNDVSIIVATVNSIQDYPTGDQTIESFGMNLFNNWGVGSAKKNNGVLMLVAVKDRKIRIQLGSGYGSSYDATMTKIIASDMSPSFKAGQFGAGFRLGAASVMNVVGVANRVLTPEEKKAAMVKTYVVMGGIAILLIVLIAAAISAFRSGKTGWGWIFLAAIGAIIWFLFRLMPNGRGGGGGYGGGSSSGGGGSGSF